MCGICGYYDYRGSAPASEDVLSRMCGVIVHRGPDDQGIYVDGSFGFGMRRLSIVDLAGGHQPIFNEDRSALVVCNGEIYNSPKLRRDLEARGHKFSTHSDCEAIIHLYEDHGPDFVRHLQGMFGLAVWDLRQRRLVIARDRLGIKPLHVAHFDGKLAFASELKSLLQVPGLERRIDPEALDAYLALSYVPGPRSIFEGIEKLEPGCMMVADKSGVRTERYWQLKFPARGQRPPRRPEEIREGLRALLRETVREHLLSDVPVGVFLSGGIDSSIVVSQVAEFLPKLKTFSIGFRENSYDEAPFARAMAERLGTEHHEMIVEPEHAAEVVRLVSYLDEPFGDLSAVPVYFLSGLARSQVTVALSGDGGDELFGGYMTYVADHLARYYRMIPRPLRDGVIRQIVRRLPTSYDKVSFDYKIKRFVEAADQGLLESHVGWKQVFGPEERQSLYHRDYRLGMPATDPLSRVREVFSESESYEFLDRMLDLDIRTYLVDDILTKVDRMSMAHSLEVRPPFLDHKFVEYAAAIPPDMKQRGFDTKIVLKEAYADLLPRDVRSRKKQGFIFPASVWLQQGLREFSGDLLSPASVAKSGMFDAKAIQAMLREHRDGVRDRARSIWNLMVFMAWHEHYLGDASVSDTVPAARAGTA